MEAAAAIGALIGVGAEAVAHRLYQVLRQTAAAVTVDVIEGSAEAGHRNAGLGGSGDNGAQGRQAAVDLVGKPRIHHQVGQAWIAVVGILNALQQAGADDAAPFPDLGDR